MSYLHEELLDIKSKINDEIITTEKIVLKYKALTKPISPENAIGRVSRMDAINNKSVHDSALLKAETKVKHLHLATEKIEDADFGVCRICKNQLPFGRILMMPQITNCVICSARM
ncbi:MAG: TraR/DksA family transcriptional regulator [Flavobacteriaceae bacterium CG_4_8_14_3_um_filter_34_10]|nr:TraR/DksA family transcriptional regulator [Flavobacteriia bacterium]PIQ18749.1 MAG: TraR/DksA family transcriptional regulator [Flavobacteriaceae bacterium CG18_big_fil_WC_8_21_14_2_50_34_36]PIV48344.1 MAG: TraR/DksA family transcriptional regulator [Flavobacteriaceae bacterium CG02_land_8_20_14_3_00_34_13]PIX09259.1 MAG: TraR/DksA family transcriptional regulator [Flavobacteriaceae bacterium CG_4_8_14_3_um_filter_34_10]PIZ07265.1 MAG: TraR/DksA family transcriptional regulator [Flavobacter